LNGCNLPVVKEKVFFPIELPGKTKFEQERLSKWLPNLQAVLIIMKFLYLTGILGIFKTQQNVDASAAAYLLAENDSTKRNIAIYRFLIAPLTSIVHIA
jgi:hypothetical protein